MGSHIHYINNLERAQKYYTYYAGRGIFLANEPRTKKEYSFQEVNFHDVRKALACSVPFTPVDVPNLLACVT